MPLTCVSLFSGCGGLDYGLHEAGFDIVFATDSDARCAESHKANFDGSNFVHLPVEALSKEHFSSIPRPIDLLAGGPPCPPFSKSRFYRTDKPRALDDPVGDATVTGYLKALRIVRPKTFLHDDEHPGWTVTVQDSPALFDADTEFQFHAHHESRFPVAAVAKILDGGGGLDVRFKVVPLTQWSATVLKPIVAVAARRKRPIQMFRHTGRAAHLVQIGDTWLGAAMPQAPNPEQSVDEPSIEAMLAREDDE